MKIIFDLCKSNFKMYVSFSNTRCERGCCVNCTAAFRHDDYTIGEKSLLDGHRAQIACYFLFVPVLDEKYSKELLAVSEAGEDFFPRLLSMCKKDVLLTLGKIRIAIKRYPDKFFASSSPWKYST